MNVQELTKHIIYFNYCDSCGWSIKTKDKDLSMITVNECGGCRQHGLSFVGMTEGEYQILSTCSNWEEDIRPALSFLRGVNAICDGYRAQQ